MAPPIWLRLEVSAMATVTAATCQFPVGADTRSNVGYVIRQMRTARRRGADVAHFPEAALSGYATVIESFDGFDRAELDLAMAAVVDCARQIGLWVVLGSAHRLTGTTKPHNCLYVINDLGELVDRYDKRFCSGDQTGQGAISRTTAPAITSAPGRSAGSGAVR
jgi:deaminated glutathione amidase